MAEAITAHFRDGKLFKSVETSQDRARSREDRRTARCAVADGATRAFRSEDWAARLVDSFLGFGVDGPIRLDPHDMDSWLGRMQQDWVDRPPPPPPHPPAPQNLAKRSSATFLGCQIDGLDTRAPRWSVVAMGDSVLFHVRDGELLQQFPEISEFNNHPATISTRADLLEEMRTDLHFVTARDTAPLRHGDRLYLATDEVAKWIIRWQSPGLWGELAQLVNPDFFTAWMTQLRETRTMEDDDVTLLRVEIAMAGAEWVAVVP